jgi:uncharacterized lipoprotein NlpE involved in copper resistance
MSMRVAFLLGVAALLVSACMPRTEGSAATTTATPVDMHNSQNSLDWAGAYEGTLPCADCPGIKTRLTLNNDGSYELSTQYLNRQLAPQVLRGQFTWNAAGNAITLDANGRGQGFAVGEGRLTLLNRDGSSQTPAAPNRVLTKVP